MSNQNINKIKNSLEWVFADVADSLHDDAFGLTELEMAINVAELLHDEELKDLKKLAYMVDQRNEQGEGNVITYKDALAGVEASCKAWKAKSSELQLENTHLQQALEEAEAMNEQLKIELLASCDELTDYLDYELPKQLRKYPRNEQKYQTEIENINARRKLAGSQ